MKSLQQRVTSETIRAFLDYLRQEERADGTMEKYIRDVCAFSKWLGNTAVTKEAAAAWKEHLLQAGYAPSTINSMLAALNTFFCFMGWADCRIKFLKIQRQLFRDAGRELKQAEFTRLLETARLLGRERLMLLIETIAATGIRVSEVRYITLEAVAHGQAKVSLKGKIRIIFLPEKLCRKLRKYAAKQKITSGEIFLTRSGKPLGRRQIWAEMKSLCARAGVAPGKVFPHNLRHLFATKFYRVCQDISRLADVLGHSSIETTRIYLKTTGNEHRRVLECLGFVT